jgi:hypothetical protein
MTQQQDYKLIYNMKKSQIEILTEMVQKLVNNPVAPVAPVAPVLPIAPIVPANSTDHDTIVKIVEGVANLDSKFTEKFNDLKSDIKNLGDGTTTKIQDHEGRLRNIEQRLWVIAGGLVILTFLAPYLLSFIKK